MHTSSRFKERISFLVSILLLIVAGILRKHEIIVLIFLVPGFLLLFISSFYTIKRRVSNLVVNIKNLFK